MDQSTYEDELLDEPSEPGPSVKTAEGICAQIMLADSAWSLPDEPLSLAGTSWQPDLVHKTRGDVLYVHLSERIRPFLVRRLEAARTVGRRVHVALDFASLYQDETLLILGHLDAEVHLVGGQSVHKGRFLLALLADESVPVTAGARSELGRAAWERRAEGSTHEKGRRFEALLAFLLAQVDDFKIRERNYRGDTDEIDIIVQVDRISTRCWYASGVPFILVEAKNWQAPVGQKEISAFIFKMSTKRERCKIGFFFASGGFTSDAALQELKLATTDLVLVLVGPTDIEEWVSHQDPDEYLEVLVSRAMLR